MKVLQDTSAIEMRYAELLNASRSGSVYQTMDWLRVVKSLRCELVFVEVDRDTLIPFACKGKGTLRRAFSLPYDTYGGPVATVTRDVDYDAVFDVLKIPTARVVDFSSGAASSSCEVEKAKTYLVELDRGYESVAESYTTMNRRAIRQAENRGLRITTVNNIDDVASFYSLYRQTIRRFHRRPLPLTFFHAIFRIMVPKRLATFYLAWHGDSPVACNLVLTYNGNAYDWTWGYDPRYLHLRPSNALIDRAIRDQVLRGAHLFNLGTSPVNGNGNATFKEGFGAKSYEYHILSQTNRYYRAARKLKRKSLSVLHGIL